MGVLSKKKTDPYSVAVAWLAADPRARKDYSPQQISDARRIAALPAIWGARLESLGQCYDQARWVAGPGPRRLADVERRYRALTELLSRGGSWDEWRALADGTPRVARRA